MKNRYQFTIFAALILSLTLCLCACSSVMGLENKSPEENRPLIAVPLEVYDGIDADDVSQSYTVWKSDMTNYHQRSGAPSQKTVEFMGETYTGTYKKSVVWTPRTYDSDFYYYSGVSRFSVRATDGALESISLNKAIPNISQVGPANAAREIVSAYIDPDRCRLSTRDLGGAVAYEFILVEPETGVDTTAHVGVVISSSGNLLTFDNIMIEETDSALAKIPAGERKSLVARLSSDSAKNSITEYFESRHSGCKLDIDEGVLAALPDGGIGMIYIVDAEIPNGEIDGEMMYISELIEMLVTE